MEKKLRKFAPTYVSPQRSALMSKVKSKGNKSTEVFFRMLLVRNGIRGWQMHCADLPGKPDFFFRSKKVVLFVDGCFWHGCPSCKRATKTNRQYWETKILGNKKRDKKNNKYYKENGFTVIRIWEHELRKYDVFSFTDLLCS